MPKCDFSATFMPVTILMEASSPTLQELGERLRNRAPRPIVDVTGETTFNAQEPIAEGAFGTVFRVTWLHATPGDRFGQANNAVVKFIFTSAREGVCHVHTATLISH